MKTTNVKIWGTTAEAYADASGTVYVWDSVAGHFTTCHSLTPGQVRRVRALASESPAATLGRKGGQARTEKKAAASRKNAKKGGRPVQVDGVIVWDPDYTGGNCHAEWYDSEADAVAAYADFLLDAAKAVIEFDTREGTDEPNDLEEQAKIETAAFVRALRPATRGKLTVTAEGTKYASKNGRMVANGSELVEK